MHRTPLSTPQFNDLGTYLQNEANPFKNKRKSLFAGTGYTQRHWRVGPVNLHPLHEGIRMSTLIEELSMKARALSPGERVQLAEELLATVQEPDAEIEAAWDEEIQRRVAEIDNGTAKLVPAEEVFAELRRIVK